jgi:2-methylisocitrate lyase-like PEP mutase family enzyme
VVVNARVDVFLGGDSDTETDTDTLADGIARAKAYLAAGADCVYPILLRSESALATFVAAVPGPVNTVLPLNGSVAAQAALGVARVSLGPQLWRRTLATLGETTTSLLATARVPS